MEGRIKMLNKRLYRVKQGAMLAGVCQGIADYFSIDATIIRLAWVVLAIFSFAFPMLVLYIACLFIIPVQERVYSNKQEQSKSSVFDSNEYTIKDEDKFN